MATISPIHPAYAAQQIGVLPPNMLTPASGIAPYYPGPGMPYSSSKKTWMDFTCIYIPLTNAWYSSAFNDEYTTSHGRNALLSTSTSGTTHCIRISTNTARLLGSSRRMLYWIVSHRL